MARVQIMHPPMNTDPIPRQAARKVIYQKSDGMLEIPLPPLDTLRALAEAVKATLAAGDRLPLQRACNDFSVAVAAHFEVPPPPVSVLGVRPHRTNAGVCVYEKYGDYTFATQQIRIWMKTAIQQKVTSYGTLLSTLTHELIHHLDQVRFGFEGTPHTRGFYVRAALLYHHAKGTPLRPLVWVRQSNGTYRIDWAKTMRGQ